MSSKSVLQKCQVRVSQLCAEGVSVRVNCVAAVILESAEEVSV